MRVPAVCVTVLLLFGWLTAGVSAASRSSHERQLVADLNGRPIKPSLIGSYYCHDFDFPRIHCYRTASDLAKGEARWGASDGKLTTQSAAFGVNDYVSVFDGNAYTGATMDMSQNYDTLAFIGWNDRISSFKARNSASGEFWTDWFATGIGRLFCCNTWVSALPSDQDNAFTSVYRH
jgi:hypothetical protein